MASIHAIVHGLISELHYKNLFLQVEKVGIGWVCNKRLLPIYIAYIMEIDRPFYCSQAVAKWPAKIKETNVYQQDLSMKEILETDRWRFSAPVDAQS